jgi:hypothetical protein
MEKKMILAVYHKWMPGDIEKCERVKSLLDKGLVKYETDYDADLGRWEIRIEAADHAKALKALTDHEEAKSKWDINYLTTELLPKRAQEITDGKNYSTRQPIYVVLDLQENIFSGHSEYDPTTNYKGKEKEEGYVDLAVEPEDREFSVSDEGMKEPEEITRFWTDRIIAFFLTSGGANEYLEYQKHNLGEAYVYVFYSGYGNQEMDKLLNNG